MIKILETNLVDEEAFINKFISETKTNKFEWMYHSTLLIPQTHQDTIDGIQRCRVYFTKINFT